MAEQQSGSDRDGRAALIEGLNVDLSHEYAAMITYRTYASAVRGPSRPELRKFFEAEVLDEMGHAGLICDKIIALGGTPTTSAAPVKMTEDAREMLQNALQDEVETLARYVERRKQAESLGEYGLVVDLDDVIRDESKHRDELRLMLDRWR